MGGNPTFLGRNRESRRREAAGRRDWPEAVPRKMRGRKSSLTEIRRNRNEEQTPAARQDEVATNSDSLIQNTEQLLKGGKGVGLERVEHVLRGQSFPSRLLRLDACRLLSLFGLKTPNGSISEGRIRRH